MRLLCSFCLLTATWRKHRTGDLSTAGTTASTVLLRDDHMFVAHVGDSTAVLAVNNPMSSQHPVKAVVLTRDHKPEDVEEILHIQELGELLSSCYYVVQGYKSCTL